MENKQLSKGEEKFIQDIIKKAAQKKKQQPNPLDNQGPTENPLY